MNIYKLEDILNDNSNPPDPIIGDGLLLPQTLMMITGLPKSKKSMLAANLAISIASGNSFSFFEIKKTFKVLILSAEGGYFPNRDRFKKMCAAINFNGSENLNLGFDSRFKIENDEEYQEVKDIIDKFKPEVLVIDPFVKFHHKDENSATDMGVILERLRNLIEDHKLSIILVHHLGKKPQSGARGSSAILGEYDTSLTLHKTQDTNKLKVEFDLRHAEIPSSCSIIFNPDNFWFGLEENKFVKLLEADSYGPMNKKDYVAASIVEGLYQDDSGAYKRIDKELELGSVVLNPDGLYHPNE
jgi:RecA-family ATPase